jgi:hypothetical protein
MNQVMGRREALRLSEFRAVAESEASARTVEEERLKRVGTFDVSSADSMRRPDDAIYAMVVPLWNRFRLCLLKNHD